MKENKNNEYTALKKTIKNKIKENPSKKLKIEKIRIISPNKFNDGGADIFEEHNKNQHNASLGKTFIKPLFK